MSDKIVHLNEEVIKGEIRELVRGSVEEALNGLLEAEAEKLTQAARYERTCTFEKRNRNGSAFIYNALRFTTAFVTANAKALTAQGPDHRAASQNITSG